jgi:hypothetical protein
MMKRETSDRQDTSEDDYNDDEQQILIRTFKNKVS